MRKTSIVATLAFAITGIVLMHSCKEDKDPAPTPAPEESIADNTTFTSFLTWSLDATAMGADPALGGMAHGGNDSTVTRNVYFKNGQKPTNGVYPIGTVIVKHSSNKSGTVNERTAMVKRGNNFNPTKGNWEFFMLKPDGTIAEDPSGAPMRGANLMNGMCGSCHDAASAKDFVFSTK